VFDGELIALSDRGGDPVEDFAAVGRAVFGHDPAAAAQLHYVAFDVLAAGARGDVQHHPWERRTALLAERLPTGPRLRSMSPLPATSETHARLIAMGLRASCSSARARATDPPNAVLAQAQSTTPAARDRRRGPPRPRRPHLGALPHGGRVWLHRPGRR
jgi:hypothetical protein